VRSPSATAFATSARGCRRISGTLVSNKCDLAVGLPVADTLTPAARLHHVRPLSPPGLQDLARTSEAVHWGTRPGGRRGDQRPPPAPWSPRAAAANPWSLPRQLTRASCRELAAEEIARRQQALSEITGEFTSEDLLGGFFAGFCIGK